MGALKSIFGVWEGPSFVNAEFPGGDCEGLDHANGKAERETPGVDCNMMGC